MIRLRNNSAMREHNNNGAGWVTLSAKHVPTYLSHRQHAGRIGSGWVAGTAGDSRKGLVYLFTWPYGMSWSSAATLSTSRSAFRAKR